MYTRIIYKFMYMYDMSLCICTHMMYMLYTL